MFFGSAYFANPTADFEDGWFAGWSKSPNVNIRYGRRRFAEIEQAWLSHFAAAHHLDEQYTGSTSLHLGSRDWRRLWLSRLPVGVSIEVEKPTRLIPPGTT